MKFLVHFQKEMSSQDFSKQLAPTDTCQNLYTHISLNFNQMDQCKMYYHGKIVPNDQTVLISVFNLNCQSEYHVDVVYLNARESLSREITHHVEKYWDIVKGNSIAVGVLIALVVIIIFMQD